MHDIGTSINIDKDCLHCEDIVLPESIWVSPGSKASVDCSYEIHVPVQIMLFMRCSIHALTLYSPAQVTLLGPSKFVSTVIVSHVLLCSAQVGTETLLH